MARSASDYLQAALALLPPGRALTRDPGSVLAAFLLAWGDGFARFEARLEALMREADPRTTSELMPEWQADYGLPDPCSGQLPLLTQQRQQLAAKITGLGGQSIAYFVALAAANGFDITITEPQPWTCDSACIDPLYSLAEGWEFAWYVHAPPTTERFWTCNDSCIAPLATWGNQALECIIRRYAPADTTVLFEYGD